MDRPECFVITAIGKRGSPERETADRHFEIIRRAAEAAGLDAVRMDRVDTEELRNTMSRKLKTARIVVADLTNANANAAYELGWFVLASVDDSAYADADDVSGDIVLEENQTA